MIDAERKAQSEKIWDGGYGALGKTVGSGQQAEGRKELGTRQRTEILLWERLLAAIGTTFTTVTN